MELEIEIKDNKRCGHIDLFAEQIENNGCSSKKRNLGIFQLD